jgi:hypothetical protein
MSTPRVQAIVVDDNTFRQLVALEIPKAVRLQYPVSLVTIERTGPNVESLAAPVRRVVRAADLVGVVDSGAVVRVLLMNADLKGAQSVIDRLLGELGDAIAVRVGVAGFPATVETAEELIAQADAAAGLGSR